MTCKTDYEELMSLKLDGMLPPTEVEELESHVTGCAECAPVWEAMREADSLIWSSTRILPPVPEGFHASVMARVAASPVKRTALLPVAEASPARVPVGIFPSMPATALDERQDWQRALGGYLRGAAAVAISLLGTLGLLIALVMSGVLVVGEPVSSMLEPLRTMLNAAGSWARSLAVGLGPGLLTMGGLLLGALLLAGWQVVAGYHRNIFDQSGGMTYTEAAA